LLAAAAGDIAPPSAVAIYLSSDGALDASDVRIDTTIGRAPRLRVNRSARVNVPISIPPDTTPGIWFLLAKADALDEADESNECNNVGASPAFRLKELSGPAWLDRFPGSDRLDDLDPSFRTKVTNFIAALDNATIDPPAVVSHPIEATYRPPERAYLFHWSYLIAKKRVHPRAAQDFAVPGFGPVEIEWWHGDLEKSRAAAYEMADRWKLLGAAVPPALASRHTQRLAIDMSVSWTGTLLVTDAGGVPVFVTGPPGSTNPKLMAVAATFGVVHFGYRVPYSLAYTNRDRPHWSTDGR